MTASTARRLDVPAAVRGLIGDPTAEMLERGPYPAEFRCRLCGDGGLVDSGVAIVAGLNVYAHQTAQLWLQHAGCGPSEVVAFPGRGPDLEEDETIGVLGAVLTSRGLVWPFIVIEILAAVVTGDSGDAVDAVLGGLAALGAGRVGDIGHPPPFVPGWKVTPAGIHAPDGTVLQDPLPPVPDGWATYVAAAGGLCGVYVASRFGLRAYLQGGRPGLLEALNASAAAGRVAGVTAEVHL